MRKKWPIIAHHHKQCTHRVKRPDIRPLDSAAKEQKKDAQNVEEEIRLFTSSREE